MRWDLQLGLPKAISLRRLCNSEGRKPGNPTEANPKHVFVANMTTPSVEGLVFFLDFYDYSEGMTTVTTMTLL